MIEGQLNNKWETAVRLRSRGGIPRCEHYEVAVVASVSAVDVGCYTGFVSFILWPSDTYKQVLTTLKG